jgi:pyruvate/2-oxoglutarate/acetoin dehydrogenase E1 component
VPIGKAAIARKGKDVTLISYGWIMQDVRRAADRLAKEGIEAEIVDLRTLVPLDIETVLASVAKTGRAVIVHSAVEFGGFGAELAAQIQSELFHELKGPVARVGARYTPVAFNSLLESLHFPDADGIFAAAKGLMTKP